PALKKLCSWLASRLPGTDSDAGVRHPGMLLVVFCDDPAFDSFLLAEVPRTTTRSGATALEMTLALARHGRSEVVPMLVTGFETAPLDVRIRCAGGLATLGDGRGRDLLTMVLGRDWIEG